MSAARRSTRQRPVKKIDVEEEAEVPIEKSGKYRFPDLMSKPSKRFETFEILKTSKCTSAWKFDLLFV